MDIDLSPVIDNSRFLASGLVTTMVLSLWAMIGALTVGGAIGLARSYGPAAVSVPLTF